MIKNNCGTWIKVWTLLTADVDQIHGLAHLCFLIFYRNLVYICLLPSHQAALCRLHSSRCVLIKRYVWPHNYVIELIIWWLIKCGFTLHHLIRSTVKLLLMIIVLLTLLWLKTIGSELQNFNCVWHSKPKEKSMHKKMCLGFRGYH